MEAHGHAGVFGDVGADAGQHRVGHVGHRVLVGHQDHGLLQRLGRVHHGAGVLVAEDVEGRRGVVAAVGDF